MAIALSDAEFRELVRQSGGTQTTTAALSRPFIDQAQPDHGIYGMVAPAVGRAMGMNDPRMVPRVTPGMGAWDAEYVNDVVQPQRQQFQAEQLQNITESMGATAGGIATNLGIHKAFGMSPEQLQENMSKGMESGVGQIGMQMLLGNEQVQELIGGDVLGMQEQIFRGRRNRFIESGPGMFERQADILLGDKDSQDIIDMNEQTSQYATDFFNWTRKTDAEGNITALPDLQKTRGYSLNELAELDTELTRRGANIMGEDGEPIMDGMRGDAATNTEKLNAVGELAEMKEVFDTLAGSKTEVNEFVESLDKLTQGQWARVPNKSAITEQLAQMKATADIVGVSGAEMMNQVVATQNSLSQVTAGATGVSANMQGGYAQMTSSAEMVQEAYAISAANNVPVEEVLQRQQGLHGIGMQSVQGKDIMAMEYFAQEGLMTDEQYKEFERVSATGTQGEKKAFADKILEQQFGSAAAGRDMLNSPEFMAQMMKNTTDETANRVREKIGVAQVQEFDQRFQEQVISNVKGGLREMEYDTGVDMDLTDEEEATIKTQGIQNYFKDKMNQEGVTKEQKKEFQEMEQELNSVYEMTLEKTGDRVKAQAAVDDLIKSDDRYAGIREGVGMKQEGEAVRERLKKLTPDAIEKGAIQAGIESMERLDVFDDTLTDDQKAQLEDISDRAREGEDVSKDYEAFVQGLDKPLQDIVTRKEDAQREKLGRDKERLETQVAMLDPESKAGQKAAALEKMKARAQVGESYGLTDAGESIDEKRAAIEAYSELKGVSVEVAEEQLARNDELAYLKANPTQRVSAFLSGDISAEEMLGIYDADPDTAVKMSDDEKEAFAKDFTQLQDMGAISETGEIDTTGVSGLDYTKLDKGKWWKGGDNKQADVRKQLEALDVMGTGEGPKSASEVRQHLHKLANLSKEEKTEMMLDEDKREAFGKLAELQQEQEMGEGGEIKKRKGGKGEGGPMSFEGTVILTDKSGATIGTMDMSNVTASPISKR